MSLTSDHYTNQCIKGSFVPQIYAYPLDDIPTELMPIEFDATEAVLGLDLEHINQLVNHCLDDQVLDSLVPSDVKDSHTGAFRVELGQAVADFFDVPVLEREHPVSQAMLQAARVAHRIGQPKYYRVLVERTQIQQAWVDVEATSQEHARCAALDAAGDIDFASEGQSAEPSYNTSDIIEQPDQVERERLSSVRPRA